VLAPESQHQGSSAPTIGSPAVNEERTRPGYWLQYCLCFMFTLVLWYKGHLACNSNLCHLPSQVLLWN